MTNIVTIESGEAVTTSMAIADGVGYDHATVIRLVRDNKDDLEDFGRVGFQIQPLETAGGLQQREIALLNEQQATLLITYMRNNDVVRAFKKQLVKAFYEMRVQPGITLPKSLPEALRLAAKLAEERDEAIRTKAQIGSSREASAMARASAETRRANKLAEQIGDGRDWKAVKSIDWLGEVFEITKVMYQQVGKKLKAISAEMDLDVKDIEDSAYGVIKAYHIDAISELHNRLLEDSNLLAKYRQQSKAA
jgi:phage regulator Rha-like protein